MRGLLLLSCTGIAVPPIRISRMSHAGFLWLLTQNCMKKLDNSSSEKLRLTLQSWQERLIDVSKSNPLLALNRSRITKLEVDSPDLKLIAKTLIEDEGSIKLPFVQKKLKKKIKSEDEAEIEDAPDEYLLHEGDINFIYSNLGDLRRKTKKVFDNSRLTLSERGVNTLFLVIGSLEWEDKLIGESQSPLIMIPCVFNYKGESKALELKMADEDITFNPALQYYLREREEIELSDIPEDFNPEKIESFLLKIEEQVKVNSWTVSRKAWLGIFHYETLAIYQDLKNLDAQADSNTLIHALAHVGGEIIENLSLDGDLDSLETPEQCPFPVVKLDSSQLRALTLAASGRNIVIHGPPGTGKSQTITAIIAHALGQQKKILFVSSKMAALNVVHDRLQALNLGQYCLEAHGVKSGKKKVVDELKKALETNDDIKIAKTLEEDRGKLIENRKKLNKYVKYLHDTDNALGLSLFLAYGKYETLSKIKLIKAPMPSKWENILNVSSQELERAFDILEEVSNNSQGFFNRDSNALRGMKLDRIDLVTIERLQAGLKKLILFSETVQSNIHGVCRLFPKLDMRIPDLFSSVSLFKSLSTITELPRGWQQKSPEEYEAIIRDIIECRSLLMEKQGYLDTISSSTSKTPDVIIKISDNFKSTYPRWYHKFKLQYFKDKKACTKSLDKITEPSITLVMDLANKAKKLIEMETVLIPRILKFGFTSVQSISSIIQGLDKLNREYEIAKILKAWIKETKVEIAATPEFSEIESNAFATIVDFLNLNKKDIDNIIADINSYWPEGFYNKIKIEDTSSLEILKIAVSIQENLNQSEVRAWQTTRRLIEKCIEQDLLPFLQNLNKQELVIAKGIFEKRFYSLWIDAAIHSKPVLSEFSEKSQKDLIHKFKELDEKIRKLTLIDIIAEPAKIARQVKSASSSFGDSNGVGILRKEMEKKKKLKPLRVLFNEIPQVLQALKPCFLMSPLSVSTFLKPGAFNFDMVIFDEASQLPTPNAVPSILRAKQVIVAGDSKQLPPTSFFRSNIVSDSTEWEEGQIDELESLLDDCKASVPAFQETHLRWHYRSRDERLINFSNHFFYDNHLITFPSPRINSKSSGVILEYVSDGIWDKGGSTVNRKEARRVAKLIIEHFKNEPDKSLGVVAFNFPQTEAIEAALEQELLNNTDLRPLIYDEKNEPFFIKSLENIQGDERDVIIISVGYGKDQNGRMTLNFGPIGKEGGWRRLNVVVTRAKWKTVLVTSIKSTELKGINPENKGAMSLKNYIQYAESGFMNQNIEAPNITLEETNDFEDSVRKELELVGFKVDAQVGVGSFRIDLAVRNPKENGNYAIGIECDGATYHSSLSARDRDILRQEILQDMGWKIYRVWSTEWFRNREASVKLLIENVSRTINNKETSFSSPVNIDIINNQTISYEGNLLPQHKNVGVLYEKSIISCDRDTIMNPIYRNYFARIITSVVLDEGPIHIDLLMERIKELSGVNRIGANIQKNFDSALRIALIEGRIEKNKEDKEFIYETGKQYSSFRLPGNNVLRRLNQISAIEIKNALIFLIQEQFGLAYDNLEQSVKLLFGLKRVDPEESDRIKDLVDEMIANGQVVKHGPLINISSTLEM